MHDKQIHCPQKLHKLSVGARRAKSPPGLMATAVQLKKAPFVVLILSILTATLLVARGGSPWTLWSSRARDTRYPGLPTLG
jgi:hypothetical protein